MTRTKTVLKLNPCGSVTHNQKVTARSNPPPVKEQEHREKKRNKKAENHAF